MFCHLFIANRIVAILIQNMYTNLIFALNRSKSPLNYPYVTRYCVRHGGAKRQHMLRNWDILARNNNSDKWTLLRSHKMDNKLSSAKSGKYVYQYVLCHVLLFSYKFFFCMNEWNFIFFTNILFMFVCTFTCVYTCICCIYVHVCDCKILLIVIFLFVYFHFHIN